MLDSNDNNVLFYISHLIHFYTVCGTLQHMQYKFSFTNCINKHIFSTNSKYTFVTYQEIP